MSQVLVVKLVKRARHKFLESKINKEKVSKHEREREIVSYDPKTTRIPLHKSSDNYITVFIIIVLHTMCVRTHLKSYFCVFSYNCEIKTEFQL